MHSLLSVLILYTLTSMSMHILRTFLYASPNVLARRICSTIKSFFFVSDHLNSHDNNDNLGIILQGEISCLSLFGVKSSEKVYV